MSTPISFTASDMLRDKLVDPGWYNVQIDDVIEAPSKDGGSTNYKMETTIINSADGSTEFAGVPLVWYFNSKAISFAMGFLQALGVQVEPDKRYDLAQSKGQKVQIWVTRGEYDGRPKNNPQHSYKAATV